MSMGDVEDHDLILERSEPAELAKVPVDAIVRISSSDMGTMRRLYVQEGERCQTGACLALLTTEEAESIEHADSALQQASVFRVVANPLAPFQEGV
jgi:hypothetical protein